MDAGASNYNSGATEDDGSCLYASYRNTIYTQIGNVNI